MLCGQQECWSFSAQLTSNLEPAQFVKCSSYPLLTSSGASHEDASDHRLPVSLHIGFNKVMLMVFRPSQ